VLTLYAYRRDETSKFRQQFVSGFGPAPAVQQPAAERRKPPSRQKRWAGV
jgi:hypothetical protein